MLVATTSWQLAGDTSPSRIDLQNVDSSRIAFVIAAAQPGDGAIVLDSDGHGILHPGMNLLTLTSLTLNVYVRALGPKAAKLYVHSVT